MQGKTVAGRQGQAVAGRQGQAAGRQAIVPAIERLAKRHQQFSKYGRRGGGEGRGAGYMEVKG